MTTLESAAAVLRCFSSSRTELTVTEASALLSLPKSNISRLLRAMRPRVVVAGGWWSCG